MIYLIYKIHCNVTGEDYYGSTKNLDNRMNVHRLGKKFCKSKQIIDRCDYTVTVIETIDVETKQDALWRERYYTDNFPCVNEAVPIVSKQETIERGKNYYLANREEILSRVKAYSESHAEQVKGYKKKWYETNKDAIRKKSAEKCLCEVCNVLISRNNMSAHKKSKSHIAKVESLLI